MAQWESKSIKDVVTMIKDGDVVLPVIQRRLVWKESEMELLFNTLLKGHSFGAVIALQEEGGRKPLFAFRRFTDDGNTRNSEEADGLTRRHLFIIDGQQRLQSFYIGLIGSLNGKKLYFDLYSDYEEGEYEFRFAENTKNLPKAIPERTENRSDAIKECLWYSVSELYQLLSTSYDAKQTAKRIIKDCGVTDDNLKDFVKSNVEDFLARIFTEPSVGISLVVTNMSKSENENRLRIVELFRRLNDGGTKLSSWDLMASMFKGYDYKMEKMLDEIVSKNESIGIGQDEIIKLVLILLDKPRAELSELTPHDADFAVGKSLRIGNTLAALREFLSLSGNDKWFASTKKRSAIPLYILAYHIFHSTLPDDELPDMFADYETSNTTAPVMQKWLRTSLLNGIFTRGCGWVPYITGITKLHAVMMREKGKNFPCEALFDVCRKHPLHTFWTVPEIIADRLDDLDRDFLFYLIYENRPTVRVENIEHIFARDLLKQMNVPDEKINRVANLALLDYASNIRKSNLELAKWLNDQKYVDQANKAEYLKRHLIPNDPKLWKSVAFDGFCDARAELIVEKIQDSF